MPTKATAKAKKANWMNALDELDDTSFLWGMTPEVYHDIVLDPSSFEWMDKDDKHKYSWMTVELSLDGGETFEVEEVPFWMRKQLLAFLRSNFDGSEEFCEMSVMREKDGTNNEANFRA